MPSILEVAMKSRRLGTGTAARFIALWVVAVILNYPWELAQSGLFAETVELNEACRGGTASSQVWATAFWSG